jgi:hypothetical protein
MGIVAGSLGAVARKNNTSIATGFMNVKAFVMVDVSGSMMDRTLLAGCPGTRRRVCS